MAYIDVGTTAVLEAMKVGLGNGLRLNQSEHDTAIASFETAVGMTILGVKAGGHSAVNSTYDVEIINYTYPPDTKFLKIVGYMGGSTWNGRNGDCSFQSIIDIESETQWGTYMNVTGMNLKQGSSKNNSSWISTLAKVFSISSTNDSPRIYVSSFTPGSNNIVIRISNADMITWSQAASITIEAVGYSSGSSLPPFSPVTAVSVNDLVTESWMNGIRSNQQGHQTRISYIEDGMYGLKFYGMTTGKMESLSSYSQLDFLTHTWDAGAKYLKIWGWAVGTTDNGENTKSHGYWIIDISNETITGAYSNAANLYGPHYWASNDSHTIEGKYVANARDPDSSDSYCPGIRISSWDTPTRTIVLASRSNGGSDFRTGAVASVEDWG